jgi:predicted transcriptional regulator of viral defense system
MNSKKLGQALYQIASLQQGYFTARQAKEAGYSDSRFPYHVRKGHWLHEGRGIYRLAQYPPSERPDLVYWSLWSCNREGKAQGTFSHETALAIHDLSDVMPAKYHLTVPPGFRRHHECPTNLVLHFQDIPPEQIVELEGYRVTSPQQTLKDVLKEENISEELVIQAIEEALERGIITNNALQKTKDNSERALRIFNAIGKK